VHDDRELLELFHAIISGDHKWVSQLLKASPHLAQRSIGIGATRTDTSEYFFEPIMHYAYGGDTALHIAAAAYQRDIAQELIAMGANPNATNRRGATPLFYAADGSPGSQWWTAETQYAVVELLIRAGANPNARDKSGVAPLHRAVRTRCTPAVHALLANGADVHCKNKSGSMPLHLAVQATGRGGAGSDAARREQVAIVQILLEHGARPSEKDANGKSVQDACKSEWIRDLLRQF
jgi:hypothetical protein